MKRTRILIVALLLAAFLLSSCGQAIPALAQGATGVTAAAVDTPADRLWTRSLLPGGARNAETKAADALFRAKFEGSAVAGSGEVVDGVYRFAATKTDGEAWHVKLESNYPTIAGRDYRVTYRFRSDVAGTVKLGDFQEFKIQPGENTVSGIVIAKGGTTYLDLQLGMLPPFTIDFTEIEIKEYADEVEYEDALSAPVNFERESVVYERHDQGYGPVLTRGSDEVSINYVAAPWDPGVWRSRLYIKTGLIPEVGTRYRITADLSCDEDMPFEILFNNDEEEKGYGALYDQKLSAGQTTHCEAVVSGSGDGDELIMQISLGMAPEESTVKLSNLRVEKIIDHYTNVLPAAFAMDKTIATGRTLHSLVPVSFKEVPLNFSYSSVDTVYEGHDDGYVVSLEESANSATYKILQAPAEGRGVWKAKLYAATGAELQPGETYRIKFDLQSTGNQDKYEVIFDGNAENAYGGLYDRKLTAGGTDSVETFITPTEAGGPLTLRFQLGETDTTAGNTVTLSNLSVDKVVISGNVNVWEEHGDGIAQSVSASGGSATLSVSQARSGGGVWSGRLFIDTGVVLEPGATYAVKAKVSATADPGAWELVYSNGREENDDYNLYGSGYGFGAGSSAQTQDLNLQFVAPAGLSTYKELVLRFQFGNSAAGNEITVSDIEVRRVTGTETNVLSGFSYPVTTAPTHVDAGYVAQPVTVSAAKKAYDGMENGMTVSASGDAAAMYVENARSSGGLWSAQLYVDTGITPEAGAKYKITATFGTQKGFGDIEVLFSNGIDENPEYNANGKGYSFDADGDKCYYGQSVGDNGTLSIEREITMPTGLSQYNHLVLRFQVGNSPADNNITVSNIKVEKWVPEHDEGGTTTPGSFELEPRVDNTVTEAVLTGNGSSGTATVTVSDGSDYHIKLNVKTGVQMEAGKTYRISANVSGAGGWNISFMREGGGDWDYDGAVSFNPVTNVVTASQDGKLIILLKLGTVASGGSVTVSDVQVVELDQTVGENLMTASLSSEPSCTVQEELLSGFRYDSVGYISRAADQGYVTTLEQSGSSATFRILQAPDERHPWNAKLYVRTGFTPTAWTGYRVSYDLEAAKGQSLFETFYDGDSENAYGAQYNQSLAAGKQHMTFIIMPGDSKGELVLQLRPGQTEGTDGNSYTISNLKIEEVTFRETSTPEIREVCTLDTQFGYNETLETSSDKVTVRIDRTPSAGREAWRSKLFIVTGTTLKAGQKYRISLNVRSIIPAPFEVCFNDGDVEKGLGAQFGLIATPAGQYVEYVTYIEEDAPLVIQLSLGNCSAPNSIIVDSVTVERAGAINEVSDTIYTF